MSEDKEVFSIKQISLYSVISMLNYYFLLVLIGILYDSSKKLDGGPLAMISLAFGPYLAIILAIATYVLFLYLKKKGKVRLLEISVTIQLILFAISIAFILISFLSE
ncbi:hypothetical protein [Bacillus sp. EAC]|uniref:hypothetical protein n=1 Tax=Bacillus sp. EAC TaxID=1978338 RepID=UPI000B447C0F|nr:hypothetical protein [Bacillus sp. EAC]